MQQIPAHLLTHGVTPIMVLECAIELVYPAIEAFFFTLLASTNL